MADNPKQELGRLRVFHRELVKAAAEDPHQYVTGWGTAQFAVAAVEREMIQLANQLYRAQPKQIRRGPRLP